MSKKQTQGRRVIAALKRQPLTYAGMLALGAGLSPWKRAAECLHESEQIVRAVGKDGLVRWRVVAATRWTA
jgi:hypothetical protein